MKILNDIDNLVNIIENNNYYIEGFWTDFAKSDLKNLRKNISQTGDAAKDVVGSTVEGTRKVVGDTVEGAKKVIGDLRKRSAHTRSPTYGSEKSEYGKNLLLKLAKYGGGGLAVAGATTSLAKLPYQLGVELGNIPINAVRGVKKAAGYGLAAVPAVAVLKNGDDSK
jgi:hypothetical protein